MNKGGEGKISGDFVLPYSTVRQLKTCIWNLVQMYGKAIGFEVFPVIPHFYFLSALTKQWSVLDFIRWKNQMQEKLNLTEVGQPYKKQSKGFFCFHGISISVYLMLHHYN